LFSHLAVCFVVFKTDLGEPAHFESLHQLFFSRARPT